MSFLRHLVVCLTLFTSTAAFATDLQIVVRNMKVARATRTVSGHILVSIFDDSGAFPDEPENAVVKLKLTPAQAANYLVTNLPPGEYAIALLHDANDNGKMDKNGIGMPKEGFGFSNDAMGTFGPPSFKKSKFKVDGQLTTAQMKMKYF